MSHSLRFWAILLPVLSLTSIAAAKAPESASSPDAADFFGAIAAGDLEVKLFLKDASGGTAVLKNLSTRPLTIKLPDAFGAAPIAAQIFGPPRGGGLVGLPGGGGNGANAGGGNQTVGGVFGNNNNNNRNAGGPLGAGLWSIEPGKERKLKVTSVCLEYGKDEPNTRLAYTIRPIESVAKPEVAAVVQSLANSQTDQRVIQAATWHLANGLDWKALEKLPKTRHLNGLVERYFTSDQLTSAKELAARAVKSVPQQTGAEQIVSQSARR